MGTRRLFEASWLLLALGGCLASPERKECIDFPLDTTGCPAACELYCEEVVARCPEVYSSVAACRNDCANEPVTELIEGTFGDESGNSLACRITYLRRGECSEVGLLETTACVGASCEDYCDIMIESCDGAYAGPENCLDSCAMIPRATDDTDQNSLECRFKYAGLAETSGDDADCDRASFGGGGVCGTVCETYCNLVEDHCQGEFALYPDRTSCESVCELMNTEGRFDDWQGQVDSVQCRIWHAGPPANLQPSTHCKHVRVYNEEQCGSTTLAPREWPCSTYCDVVLRNCPGVYADETECQADCATFPELDDIPPEGPQLYPITTLQCPVR